MNEMSRVIHLTFDLRERETSRVFPFSTKGKDDKMTTYLPHPLWFQAVGNSTSGPSEVVDYPRPGYFKASITWTLPLAT